MSPGSHTRDAWRSLGRAWVVVSGLLLVVVGASVGIVLSRRAPEPAAAPSSRAVQGPAAPVSPPAAAPTSQLLALAAQVEPESTPTAKILEFARAALRDEQFALAIPAYRRVLERQPKNPEALSSMGFILYQAGHVEQALARVDEALAADPKYALGYWHRANMLYRARRDLVGARKSLEQYLALVPQGIGADRARALLAEIGSAAADTKP